MIHCCPRHLFVVSLILLLGAQFTGLSCLEDWRNAAPTGSAFDTPQITDVAMASGEFADDGCPCHMVFVSIVSRVSQPSHPGLLVERSGPGMSPTVPPFLPFHPPLSL
jgi:hypothetical protein